MLQGPLFARLSYTMFAVAVSLAVLKLGGALDPEPPYLETVPAEPVAKTSEPASGREDARGEVPERPGEGGPALRYDRRFAAGFAGPFVGGTVGKRAKKANTDAGVIADDTPVFRRPSGGASSGGGPVCGDLGDVPKSSRVVFPLPEGYFGSYDDTWGAARPQGGHEESDLMSPAGTPEFAITDGTIVPVKKTNGNGWNRLGGYTVMLRAAYDAGPIKKSDLFYYAHMDEESALPAGTEVRAGERIGSVGDTGEGPEGTRGKSPPTCTSAGTTPTTLRPTVRTQRPARWTPTRSSCGSNRTAARSPAARTPPTARPRKAPSPNPTPPERPPTSTPATATTPAPALSSRRARMPRTEGMPGARRARGPARRRRAPARRTNRVPPRPARANLLRTGIVRPAHQAGTAPRGE